MAKLNLSDSDLNEKCRLLLVARKLGFEKLASTSGFYRRLPKKVSATALILSFWVLQSKRKNSLRSWAVQLGAWIGGTVTKQSIDDRIGKSSVKLAEGVLGNALRLRLKKNRLRKAKAQLSGLLLLFNRIVVRDSTTVSLPKNLGDAFPGNHSQGKQTAVMRVQSLYDLSNDEWLSFGVGAYTDNDQGAAASIADELEPRDLLLQDLGYFTLDWIAQVIVNQYLITKWDNKTKLMDMDGGALDPEKIEALLKDADELDMPILLGAKKKIKLRMVLRKLPRVEYKKRLSSARKDRHSKTNHSESYYAMLRYEIYLTNIPEEMVTGLQIAKLYGLRWYIEILFKSWKSYGNMTEMFDKWRMNEHKARFSIYIMLAAFTYFLNEVKPYVENHSDFGKDRYISILKFFDLLNDFLKEILSMESMEEMGPLIPMFSKHATYDKHTKQTNFAQKYLYINELYITKKQT